MKSLFFLAALPMLFIGYAAGVLYPVRFHVPLQPKPWAATTFYETQVPDGWKIVTDGELSTYKYREYRAGFPLRREDSRAETILGDLQKRVPSITKIYNWAWIGKVQIEIKSDNEWRDVDVPVSAALSQIGSSALSKRNRDPALDRAVRSWSAALGKQLRTPDLYHGECPSVQIFVVACAEPETYSITVVEMNYVDPFSIYLHEIGHLLGVKHIKGDSLMEGDYSGPVTGVTKAAVDAAKHPQIDGEK
jgi:hypothetical protein